MYEIKILFLSHVGTVCEIIAGGFILFLLTYFREKGKNVATREDIEKITDKIEGVKLEYAMLLKR